MTQLLLLPGDGIGPEIVEATHQVLKAVAELHDLELTYRWGSIGFESLAEYGTTITGETIEAARKADGIVLGPVSHNEYPSINEGGLNPSAVLRKSLDLYANVRPAVNLTGITGPTGKPMDLVIFRENTEGFYADRNMHSGPAEHLVTEDVSIALRRVTRQASMRIAQAAFKQAEQRRSRVTAVHKANVLRTTCGLFLECCREVASQYPGVVYEEQLVDSMAALLVRQPEVYDVVVTTNMFGDILSDLASELAGSLGIAPSLNSSETHAMAQAQHGSAPDLAGMNQANPISLISSTGMLLAWLTVRSGNMKFLAAANSIDRAISKTLARPEDRTADLGGAASTSRFTQLLISNLE